MRITLSREEALACLIALGRCRKPYKWEQQAKAKLEKALFGKEQRNETLHGNV